MLTLQKRFDAAKPLAEMWVDKLAQLERLEAKRTMLLRPGTVFGSAEDIALYENKKGEFEVAFERNRLEIEAIWNWQKLHTYSRQGDFITPPSTRLYFLLSGDMEQGDPEDEYAPGITIRLKDHIVYANDEDGSIVVKPYPEPTREANGVDTSSKDFGLGESLLRNARELLKGELSALGWTDEPMMIIQCATMLAITRNTQAVIEAGYRTSNEF